MARKARTELEGGLYHVITRGNNRRQIFNFRADYQKFLSLLAVQKSKLPFFLYAYCLMTIVKNFMQQTKAEFWEVKKGTVGDYWDQSVSSKSTARRSSTESARQRNHQKTSAGI